MEMGNEWAQRFRVWFERLRDRESFVRHGLVGPPDVWREQRRFQIDFLRRQGLQPHHSFVDVGCGTLRGGLSVIEYLETGRYLGLDVRANVLVEAQRELERGRLEDKQPTLLRCEDFATLSCDRTFDVAWAFAVLIHMTDDVCTECLRWVSRRLAPRGVFYADVLLGHVRKETVGHGMGTAFPVIWRPAADYLRMAQTAGLELEDLGTLVSQGSRMKSEGRLRHMLRMRRSSVGTDH